MSSRKRGYFPRLEKLLKKHNIDVAKIVSKTGLAEKSVRRMVKHDGPSLYTSIEKVVKCLNDNYGEALQIDREFVEAPAQ